ncbi:hypothetical protein OXX79_011068 [Metschnikowia pulcherrima]
MKIVNDSFVNHVADDESRLMRMRKIALCLVHTVPAIRATVAGESLSAFNDLKLSKRSKFIIFALSPKKTPIVVDKTSSDDDYESFLPELPGNRCKCAMVYASSKDALIRAFNGTAADIQGADSFEVAYDPVLERVRRGAGSH